MADEGNPFLQFQNKNTQQAVASTESQPDGGNPFLQFSASSNVKRLAQQSPQPTQSTAMDMIDVMNRNFAKVANGDLHLASDFVSTMDKLNTKVLNAFGIDRSQTVMPAIPQSDINNFNQGLNQNQAMHERDYNQAMKSSPITGTVADVASKIGATIATPGNQAILAAPGANLAVRGLQAFGMGANTGFQETDGSLGQRVDNALNAGFLSAAGQGAVEKAAAGFGSAFKDVGDFLGNPVKKAANKLFNTPVQQAADAVDQGLLTTVGSATGNGAIQATENVLSKVPYVGTKSAMQKQAGLLKQKTMDVLDDLGVAGKSKTELGTELSDAIKSSYKVATENTNQAYKAALDIAEKQGLTIPLTETQSIAQKALGELDQLKQAGISSADVSGSNAGKLLQDIAGLQTGDIKASLFDSLRKRVSSTISGIKGNDTEGVLPQLQQIKKALDTDLESAGMQSQQFGNALAKARDIFMNEKAPFQNTSVMDKLLKGDIDTDELLNTIIKNDRPVLTNKIVSSLSPEGQKTFSSALVNKVAQGAINDQTGKLDLQMFNRGLGKLGETVTALPKMERMKIEGLQQFLTRGDKILSAAKGSENSIPSWLSGGAAVASYMTGNMGNLMALAVASKTLSKILTSENVTRGLIKLAGGRLATTAKDGIVKSILKRIFNSTVRKSMIPAAATSLTQPSPQQPTVQPNPLSSNQGVGLLGIPG